MREPFAWGASDCMLSVADYLIDVTGVDCAERFRGRYFTARGCMRVSGFHRDPVGPFAKCVAEIPLQETLEPMRGDVGVIDFAGTVVGAICTGYKWAARADVGVLIARPTRIVRAWAV